MAKQVLMETFILVVRLAEETKIEEKKACQNSKISTKQNSQQRSFRRSPRERNAFA